LSQLILGEIQLHILWKVLLVQKMNRALEKLKEYDMFLDIEVKDVEQEKTYLASIRRVLLYNGKSVLDVINVRDGKNVISGQENIEMSEDEFLKMGSYIVSRIKEGEK
jgi:hypothetical protein